MVDLPNKMPRGVVKDQRDHDAQGRRRYITLPRYVAVIEAEIREENPTMSGAFVRREALRRIEDERYGRGLLGARITPITEPRARR